MACRAIPATQQSRCLTLPDMRAVCVRPVVWAIVLMAVLAAGCRSGEAENTTSTGSPAATSTTTSAPITTQADPTTTSAPARTTTTEQPVDVGDLLVVGDWGSGTMPQGAVAGAMARHAEDNEVEAILTTGDNFYADDHEFLMEPFGWAVEADIPFWVAWGNHDVEDEERIEAVEEAFDDPPRWQVYEWGAVDVIVLDSTRVGNDEQAEFLAEAMQSSDDPTIVAFHHPPFSCGRHGDTERVQEQWLDDFDDDVFLVLSGHEHNYQRFEGPTVTYVVTGGGGANLYEVTTCAPGGPEMVAGESTHHFLVLEQDDDVSVTAVDVNGGVIDEFTLGLP